MRDRQDTIAAIATPAGNGAIGIVRMSGPQSLAIARQITSIIPQPRHAHVCVFRDSARRVLDQGILLYFPAPRSFTGEDMVELHGHGGSVVLGLLLNEMVNLGARLARPGEFSERAYLNGRMDLVQAEAIADLINSASARAVRSAASSLTGEFSMAIHALVERMVSLRVFVESALDFPEEEIDFLDVAGLATDLERVLEELDSLLARAGAGRKLGAGLRVAIVGRPNAGKSSLLNRLLQVERAIVTDRPGTTRDTIEDTVIIEGVPITLIDTAGVRESEDPVEREGIRRTREATCQADVVILVTDRPDEDLPALLAEIPEAGSAPLVVQNKIDITGRAATVNQAGRYTQVLVSALTGEGLDLLRKQLALRSGVTDSGENEILARQRHIEALNSAREHLRSGLSGLLANRSVELLAEELRSAQESLGSITGEFHNDDLLGEIFSRFCIGK